jgi:predicted esterase
MRRITLAAILLLCATFAGAADITPDCTYLYERRDTCDLFLDIYNPAKGSQTMIDGREKPTIIFVFGGGFICGSRDNESYKPWFKAMTDDGYRIVSIDYRLGLKGSKKVGIAQVKTLDNAIHIGVEDLFSATNYIQENAEQLGINPSNIVVAGTSAGAIIAMQAEYEICNQTAWTTTLPEGFRYAGIMSFSGAILSHEGKVDYKSFKPAPTLILHGTIDKLVPYKQIAIFNLGFYGGGKLIDRLKKYDVSYNMYHFIDYGHEIASSMYKTIDLQKCFLETNVMQGKNKIIEAWISDPDINKGAGVQSRGELYGN